MIEKINDFAIDSSIKKRLWFTYLLSCLTPFTLLISGVVAIVYAGYRLNKGTDGEVVESHYYALIKLFFIYLTFFVVLIVTIATANTILKGIYDYWWHNNIIEKVAYIIPLVGLFFGIIAIILWFFNMYNGMKYLKNSQTYTSFVNSYFK